MGKITILPETTKNPITLIGQRAGICWNSDTSDDQKNYKRGYGCIESNHGRALEFTNVEIIIEGYSAKVIREWYTHIGGSPSRMQASTRYIDYKNFDYVIPPTIKKNKLATKLYQERMESIAKTCTALENAGVPREDASMLLPLGMTTKIVDKRNLRSYIDMAQNRMCTRAYWEYRNELFNDILSALSEYSEEWKTLVNWKMKPKCEFLGYCPEKKSCGRKAKKDA